MIAAAPPPDVVLGTEFEPLDGTPQADILAVARDPRVKAIVAESGVGGGKTRISSFVALAWALEHPGIHGFLIGPDYQMLTVQRDALEERIQETNLGWDLVARQNRLERRYDLVNGSTIWLKSATDPNKFRNFEIDWAVLDEAQKYDRNVMTIARTRMRASRIGRIMIAATVSGRNWIYDLREKAAQDDDASVACFLWKSADNPGLSREELDYAHAHLDDATWRQEYEADRTAYASALFEHLDEVVGGVATLKRLPRLVSIGCDFGKIKDFTVITVLDSESGTVIEMERFQGVDYAGQGGVYDRLASTWRRYGRPPVAIDTGGPYGQSHADVLTRDYGVTGLQGLSTGNRRRSGPIEALINAFRCRKVRVPEIVRLPDGQERKLPALVFRREASELIADDRGTYVRYRHPEGGHDDTVISLALAWHAQSKARPPINLRPWLKQGQARSHFGGRGR